MEGARYTRAVCKPIKRWKGRQRGAGRGALPNKGMAGRGCTPGALCEAESAAAAATAGWPMPRTQRAIIRRQQSGVCIKNTDLCRGQLAAGCVRNGYEAWVSGVVVCRSGISDWQGDRGGRYQERTSGMGGSACVVRWGWEGLGLCPRVQGRGPTARRACMEHEGDPLAAQRRRRGALRAAAVVTAAEPQRTRPWPLWQ